MEGTKEENVLFNDALNTFYLWLYGIKHMVKYHSAKEETSCHRNGLLLPISSKLSFICTTHRLDSSYHAFCYTSREALTETINSSMGPP